MILEPDRKWASRPVQIDAATCAHVQPWLQEYVEQVLVPTLAEGDKLVKIFPLRLPRFFN
jgi:hypothetical protein